MRSGDLGGALYNDAGLRLYFGRETLGYALALDNEPRCWIETTLGFAFALDNGAGLCRCLYFFCYILTESRYRALSLCNNNNLGEEKAIR